MPANLIKLDKSFIAGVPFVQRHSANVQAIVRLAHELEIDVIAEGIASPAQARFVNSLGIEVAQGLCYHKPIPVTDIDLWLLPCIGTDCLGRVICIEWRFESQSSLLMA